MHISKIGIIGGGSDTGQAFARALARAGIRCASSGPFQVRLSSSVWERGELEKTVPITEAAEEEIVLLAIPWREVPETLSLIPDWEGRILIDATDPILPDRQAGNLGGRTSSEIVCDLAPGAQVVKAFNTLSPKLIASEPEQSGGRRVVFFSGNHLRAKREIGRLIDHLGFAGIDLGGLAEGGRLQQFPDGPLRGLNLIQMANDTD